ncbi:uncharacterized protein LOC108621963 [Ceratina calcarata]|uniref:Uncharacterized protein LOC108621963 n=1 Tax=Ceratina calcarata TaxID=156304 RepID=A0AAJ7N2Z0_9HYME|nr:uncharacterized protein LOC108621963 [Ceratina calcarata]
MQYSALCIVLVLAITDSVFVQAQPDKVMLVIPQRARRMGVTSLRPVISRYRKSSHGGELDHRRYLFYRQTKRPGYGKPVFPHGGDDFDQGYEHVNHVHVPYGKSISHALSFGKGYIPYDRMKVRGSFSFGSQRQPGAQEQKNSEPEYSSSAYASSGSGTSYSSSGPSYESSPSESETLFSSPESAISYNEGSNEDENQKFYTSRSIEKDTTANNPIDLRGKEQLYLLQQKGTSEFYENAGPSQSGGVSLPSGIPSPTIGGSKDGIVLRDSVALDDYRQKVQEMTKSWSQFMQNPSVANYNFQSQPSGSYSFAYGSPVNVYGTYSWPVSFAQPKQGYAVKEDTMESSHDFRTMPVNTSPYQTGTVPMNAQISALGVTQALLG